MSSRPLSKAEKSLGFFCVFALIPLAAVVFVAGSRDAEPTWNIAPATPRPKPNGYDFYVAAAKATVRFTPEIDPASDVRRPMNEDAFNGPYALQNYSLARRSQWIAANARTFSLFNQGLKTPSMAPEYSIMGNSDWSKLRQLARDVNARSRTFQMAKQPMRATMSALDGVQMAQDTTRGGALLARLVGVAMQAIVRDPLDDWNKTIDSLSAAEARIATKRLEAILAREPTTAQTLTLDKRVALLELRRGFATQNWRGSWPPGSSSLLYNSTESYSQAWQRQTIPKGEIVDNVNRVYDDWIADSRQSYSKAQSAPIPSNLDGFSKSLIGAPHRYLQSEARSQTSNTMLLLRLALRAYIAEHKAAPLTLSALVPAYLKAIPTDVYNDGKPLFYQPKGATYKLWSIGPDMKNDGGIPFSRKSGDKGLAPVRNTLVSKGDFVAGLCK